MTASAQPFKLIDLKVGNQVLSFSLLNYSDLATISQILAKNNLTSINVFASGPSIAQLEFDANLLGSPAIWVNGSLSLISDYPFSLPIAYIISDERFIEHNLSVIQTHLTKISPQTLWCMALPVLKALCVADPELVICYHSQIRLIFAVDRPIVKKANFLREIFANRIRQNVAQTADYQLKKQDLAQLSSTLSQNKFVINSDHQPVIGVSLDITQGFVEAGTVAFVACQLAFGFSCHYIHLYGVDLSNSEQPRFYENRQNQAPSKLDKAVNNRIVPSFDLMATVYAQQCCQVYNHSVFSRNLFTKIPFIE